MPSEKECDELADNCEWKYMAYKKHGDFLSQEVMVTAYFFLLVEKI